MGGLSTFCGLHAKVHGEHQRVIHGLADEILERLVKLDGLSTPHLTINDGILAQAFDISGYKLAADELVTDAGARLLFHAMAVGAVMADDDDDRRGARRVEVGARRGARAGSSSTPPVTATSPPGPGCRSRRRRRRRMLYPSLMFRINGVDVAAAGPAPWRTVERLMEEAEAAGTHTFPRKKPIVRPQRNPLEWRANLTQLSNPDGTRDRRHRRRPADPRRAAGAPAGLRRVRLHQGPDARLRGLLHRRHRARRSGSARPGGCSGRYQLTEDDVLGLRRLRRHHRGQRVAGGGARRRHGRVPLAARGGPRGSTSCLPDDSCPERVGNLFVAGRCASMTHGGQSSARVTGPLLRDGGGGRDGGRPGHSRRRRGRRRRRRRAAAAPGAGRRLPRPVRSRNDLAAQQLPGRQHAVGDAPGAVDRARPVRRGHGQAEDRDREQLVEPGQLLQPPRRHRARR